MDGPPNRMLLTVSAGNGKDSDILGFTGSSRIQIPPRIQIPLPAFTFNPAKA